MSKKILEEKVETVEVTPEWIYESIVKMDARLKLLESRNKEAWKYIKELEELIESNNDRVNLSVDNFLQRDKIRGDEFLLMKNRDRIQSNDINWIKSTLDRLNTVQTISE